MSICRKRFVPYSAVLALLVSPFCHAATWFPFGPDGGDARSFAVDPHDATHLYLGTATGWIYESRNEGQEWKRLARVGKRDDLVLDSIVVDHADPKHLIVGAWDVARPDSGGLFVSKDAGNTWSGPAAMQGQSVLALAEAPSDPKIWVAGTLTGVQRSDDNGEHWQLISPPENKEIHEVESIAIDPLNPLVIYAGTWHLPWKTTDGGSTWNSIKEGVIDDSDVFSIIVDPAHPATVYASACSGIYKSDNAGARFQKVEGIPSTARRTRVLMQDPKNHDIVFAGTTEGLWRTGDAGKIWIRMTGPEVIVNDVFIDPTSSNKLLVATDRGGVLASEDGGASFHPANKGFSARHLSSFLADAHNPAVVYVGALNDKQWGGVFQSDNGGLTWMQQSGGLAGSDVFSLGQALDGTILAGTGHGIYRLKDGSWGRVAEAAFARGANGAPAATVAPSAPSRKGSTKRVAGRRPMAAQMKPLDGAVYAITMLGDSIFAATSQGLLVSATSGLSWKAEEGLGAEDFYFLSSARSEILAAGLKAMRLSKDGGATWKEVAPPGEVSQITASSVDAEGGLWVGGREGVFLSQDNGASWQSLKGLFVNDVNSIFYDQRTQRVLITNTGGTFDFTVQLPEKKVTFSDTGWKLRFVRPVGDYLVGVTPFDGVVVQPRMVDSAESAHP